MMAVFLVVRGVVKMGHKQQSLDETNAVEFVVKVVKQLLISVNAMFQRRKEAYPCPLKEVAACFPTRGIALGLQ